MDQSSFRNANQMNSLLNQLKPDSNADLETIVDLDSVLNNSASAKKSDLKSRRYPRRNFLRSASYLHAGEYKITFAGELGEGGMSLHVAHSSLEVGSEVLATFKVPFHGIVVQRAEVVHIEHNKRVVFDNHTKKNSINDDSELDLIGLSFVDIDFDQKRWIRNFVSLN